MKRTTLACLVSGVLTIGLIATMSLAAEPEDENNQNQPIACVLHEISTAGLAGAYAGSGLMDIAGVNYPVESASSPLTFEGQPDTLGGDNATAARQYNFQEGSSLYSDIQMYIIPQPGFDGLLYTLTGLETFRDNATGTAQWNGLVRVNENGEAEMVAIQEGAIRPIGPVASPA